MRKIRYGVVVFWLLLCSSVTSASAQVSIGIGISTPNLSIGINLPLYPELAPVPGYPVYYAPQVNANYFFYDGMYWVYMNDYWYASYWYNGPWSVVQPAVVPVFILRIPVSYYRYPPPYFRGWPSNAPPRWGEHWGRGWEQQRRGWDTWNRGSVPARAPLPAYQRQYSGDRYPRQVEQQQTIHRENYQYKPRDKAVRQHYQQQGIQKKPAPVQRGGQKAPAPVQRGGQAEPRMTGPGQKDIQHQAPPQQQRGPGAQHEQKAPPQQQRGPGAQHEQQAPRPQGQGQRPQEMGRPQEPGQGQGQGQWQGQGQGQGHGQKDEERSR